MQHTPLVMVCNTTCVCILILLEILADGTPTRTHQAVVGFLLKLLFLLPFSDEHHPYLFLSKLVTITPQGEYAALVNSAGSPEAMISYTMEWKPGNIAWFSNGMQLRSISVIPLLSLPLLKHDRSNMMLHLYCEFPSLVRVHFQNTTQYSMTLLL
jgi:hypothetical protein